MRRIWIGILVTTMLLSTLPAEARAGRSRSWSSFGGSHSSARLGSGWGGSSYSSSRPYSGILRSPYRTYRRRSNGFGRSLARAAVQGAAAGAAAGLVGGVVSGAVAGAVHGPRHHGGHAPGYGYGNGYGHGTGYGSGDPGYPPAGYPEPGMVPVGSTPYGQPYAPPPRSDGFLNFLLGLIVAAGLFWFMGRSRNRYS